MTNYLKRFLIAGITVFGLTLAACQKDEADAKLDKPADKVEVDKQVLAKYLSSSLGLDLKKIQFNESKQTFFSPNTVFEMPLDSVILRYELANEYQLNNK